MADGRWFPVYYEDLAENYARVWDEPRLLWTWARLYAVHDRSWPLPGELPRGMTPLALKELAAMELISLLPKHRFTVRGLDARRNAQRSAASNAARSRHGSARSNAPTHAYQTKPEPDQTKDESKERALVAMPLIPVKGMNGEVEQVDLTDPNPDLTRLQRLAEELTGKPNVMANVYGGHGKMAAELLEHHGYERVARQFRACNNQVKAAGTSAPTLKQLVFYADDVLNAPPSAREGNREEAAAEEQARYDRRVANTRARYSDRP